MASKLGAGRDGCVERDVVLDTAERIGGVERAGGSDRCAGASLGVISVLSGADGVVRSTVGGRIVLKSGDDMLFRTILASMLVSSCP